MNIKKARVIAFYLPQFHPIPENDKHWGKGFTEWTNVGKAQPLFRGHYQPRIPADLGYYDLRLSEVREAQAEMAKEAGIEGFCYWHYWFGNGKQLLERPFNEVLASGRPDFPFCLGWANHSWKTGTWTKYGKTSKSNMIIKQSYLGENDYRLHFEYVLKAFKDKRYLNVDGKPIFVIFNPSYLPDNFIPYWQKLATAEGLPGIHFVAYSHDAVIRGINIFGKNIGKRIFHKYDTKNYYNHLINDLNFDAIISIGSGRAESMCRNHIVYSSKLHLSNFFGRDIVSKFDYSKIMKYYYTDEDCEEYVYPSLLPQWDRSPRSKSAIIYTNSTPEKFKKSIIKALELIKDKENDHKILFLKSWNEWAEGNYVEPDLKYGHGYLDAIKSTIIENGKE